MKKSKKTPEQKRADKFRGAAVIAAIIGFGMGKSGNVLYSILWIAGGALLAVASYQTLKKEKELAYEAELQQTAVYESSPVIQAAQRIEDGKLPVFPNSSIIEQGELTHFACQAIRYITKNRVIGRTASHDGFSFRVAKGLTYRTGGIRGQSIYGDSTNSYRGEFLLTSRRLLFLHGQHGFECMLDKISGIGDDDRGRIIIQKGNASCVLHLISFMGDKDNETQVFKGKELLTCAIALINEQSEKLEYSELEGTEIEYLDDTGMEEKRSDSEYENVMHNADEILKYKSLLDCGAITVEEYEAKKKVLLNL